MRFCVAAQAEIISLLLGHGVGTDNTWVSHRLSGRSGSGKTVVTFRWTVTGFAVDAGFSPGGAVGVALLLIVGRELADMATVAGGVEGVRG